jgi:hypothetical protein
LEEAASGVRGEKGRESCSKKLGQGKHNKKKEGKVCE